jgi:glycosyltransferase involved in cell wall biosynthesis
MLSICICTYNRSQSLRCTLESLVKQENLESESALEILIIDNNCTDDTAQIVEAFQEELPIRRITEPCQGLSYARNRAVMEFRGDVLLFTDDDMRLTPGWLTAFKNAIGKHPDADYFGGRILPYWESFKPRWIRDEPLALIDGVLNWFDYGTETRPYRSGDQGPIGGCFAIRRRLLDRMKGFRVDLGRIGQGLGRGEETEFIDRARQIGAKGIYVGEALCLHTIDRNRLSLVSLFRYGIASGRALLSANAKNTPPSAAKLMSFFVRGIFQLMKGRGDRFRQCIINAGIEVGRIRVRGTSNR